MRFVAETDANGYKKKKLQSSVSFPLVLDTAPFTPGKAGKYELVAVVIHKGASANGGKLSLLNKMTCTRSLYLPGKIGDVCLLLFCLFT